MKVTIEFDSRCEEDINLHKTYVKAEDMTLAFWEIKQLLRSERKYPKDSVSSETYDKICEIEDKVNDIINEYDLGGIINA